LPLLLRFHIDDAASPLASQRLDYFARLADAIIFHYFHFSFLLIRADTISLIFAATLRRRH
jgi:hypothetical protein